MYPHLSLLIPSLLLLPLSTHATLSCRPPGPIVPRPRAVSATTTTHPILANATAKLTKAIESALSGGDIEAGWPVVNTSFSLGVVLWDQERDYGDVDEDGDENGKIRGKGEKREKKEKGPGIPVWEYHHLAKSNEDGTKVLGRDAQWLVGSVAKVFSDYILLRSGVELGESVVRFLPELGRGDGDGNGETRIVWEDVTLRQLADQVGGIPPNYGFSEYYYLKDYFESLGFPHIEDDAYADCGIISLSSSCTREQFLKGMLTSRPVSAPAERPVYSNIAFTLLMYAVEAHTGIKGYDKLLETFVSGPLGLKNTVVSPGDDEKAVIPPVMNNWGADYGEYAPGGGLVSSLSDLSTFLHGILSRTIFSPSSSSNSSTSNVNPETAVREWLKPTSSTGSLHSLVGTPWEIFRTQDLIPEHPEHVVDIYAKAGSAFGYQSQIAVVDEYGLGIVVLSAGSALAAPALYDAVLATIVPALDEIARVQAIERGFAGRFGDAASSASDDDASSYPTREMKKDDAIGFNVTIALDGDSLYLAGLERDGKDIMAAYKEIWSATMGSFVNFEPVKARVFPVEIRRQVEEEVAAPASDGSEKNKSKVIREDWRVEWEVKTTARTGLPGAGVSEKNCLTWMLTDWIYYGSEPLDRIVFLVDAEGGDVVGLEIPYLRSGVLEPAQHL